MWPRACADIHGQSHNTWPPCHGTIDLWQDAHSWHVLTLSSHRATLEYAPGGFCEYLLLLFQVIQAAGDTLSLGAKEPERLLQILHGVL